MSESIETRRIRVAPEHEQRIIDFIARNNAPTSVWFASDGKMVQAEGFGTDAVMFAIQSAYPHCGMPANGVRLARDAEGRLCLQWSAQANIELAPGFE